jgi:hypothetical protein
MIDTLVSFCNASGKRRLTAVDVVIKARLAGAETS